jgi:hypothetical protein
MMLFLANTGSSSATVFKFLYIKLGSMKRRYKIRQFNNNNNNQNKNQTTETAAITTTATTTTKTTTTKQDPSKETIEQNNKHNPRKSIDNSINVTVPAKRRKTMAALNIENYKRHERSFTVQMGIRDVEIPADIMFKIAERPSTHHNQNRRSSSHPNRFLKVKLFFFLFNFCVNN